MVRVLIVEDEYLIANLIKEALQHVGYSCSCVFDGEEAANEIEKLHYDLILLDVMLPKIDVSELLARVEVVLRRYHKSTDTLEVLDLTIDTRSRNVYKQGKKIELS